MPSGATQSRFHPATQTAATYRHPWVHTQSTTRNAGTRARSPLLQRKDPRTEDHRSAARRHPQRPELYRGPGHPGLLYCAFHSTRTGGDGALEWHLQGTCRELRLRLLASNVNCGQRHRELSTIKNTLAWNRNTHKAYGIDTTKEDLRTFLSLLCRAMRLKNDNGEFNGLPSLQGDLWGNGRRPQLTSLS